MVSFDWNTAGLTNGNYTLSAYAWPVPSEDDTTNNYLTLTEQPITIIPEFPSILILSIFMLNTLTIIAVWKRKRPKLSKRQKKEGCAGDIATSVPSDRTILPEHVLEHD
jgi:hypothetical protein